VLNGRRGHCGRFSGVIRQDEYGATTDLQCVKIYIPEGDEYRRLLARLLAIPTDVASYDDPDSAQSEGLAAVWRDAYLDVAWGGCGTPPECESMDSEITIFPGSMDLVTGGAIATAVNTSALHNYVSDITPAANLNARRAFRYMEAGTWNYRLMAVTLSNGCSLTMSIVDPDGTIHIEPSFNLRTAATIFNAVFTGQFTLNQRGKTEIFLGVGAGTTGGFRDALQIIEMWRD